MIKRVFGIETEWSIIVPQKKGTDKGADIKEFNLFLKVIRDFFRIGANQKLKWEGSTSQAERELNRRKEEIKEGSLFLPNGARIYVDYPHLEYSTPECATVEDLIAADKAGNLLVQKAAEKVSQILNERIIVLKDNSNRQGASWGSHENYLLKRSAFNRLMMDSDFQKKLIPFLVSRQILCGAGKIGIERGNIFEKMKSIYQVSQRADFITRVIGSSTTSNRNIINTRDEPHADPEKFARLHLILGDANLCDWSLYLRVGTTSIVLSMLEDDFIKEAPKIIDPVKAIKQVSRNFAAKIGTINGREVSALDIQYWYLNKAREYGNFSQEEKEILAHWQFILNQLKQPDSLVGYLDWITKKYLLKRIGQRNNLSLNSGKLKAIDIAYHDLNPEKGLYLILEKRGKIKQIVSEDLIRQRMVYPPENTRAYLRGKVAGYASEMVKDWEIIEYRFNRESLASSGLSIGDYRLIYLMNPLVGKEKETEFWKKIQELRR